MLFLARRRFATAASDSVLWHVASPGVVQITLNRPSKLNSLTTEMGQRLLSVVDELKAAENVRAVVVTGAGRAFSAGGDIEFLRERQRRHNDTELSYAAMRGFYSLFLSIRQLPCPVVAAINGPAVGAGACLAAACDLRLISKTAKFGVNFTKLGISPGMAGTHFLPQAFGQQFATFLMLSGELVSGEEAHANGLSLRLLDSPEATVEEAHRVAKAIAAASPIAVRQTIRSLRLRSGAGLEASLTREAEAQAHCFSSPDFEIGLNALANKTEPKF
jgi:enoyl-CoA hydratase